jgi:hypothetical protein
MAYQSVTRSSGLSLLKCRRITVLLTQKNLCLTRYWSRLAKLAAQRRPRSLSEKLGCPIDNIEGGDAYEFAGVISCQSGS